MRALFSVLVASLLLLAAHNGMSRAAIGSGPAAPAAMELLVFEHPDCVYCREFRRAVMPRYMQSAAAAEAPLRFIDITRTETGNLDLKGRIAAVPTAVLMKDGREFDRIAGYWGPDNFLKMLTHLIARAE
ncbi:MAG: hypothetical protein F9K29_20060 [Hyphomicrobiaceae bacterium]|nr:MAG: hypothetical protein F9K29_20060 [Hyphomicrobiaceae bacterium]